MRPAAGNALMCLYDVWQTSQNWCGLGESDSQCIAISSVWCSEYQSEDFLLSICSLTSFIFLILARPTLQSPMRPTESPQRIMSAFGASPTPASHDNDMIFLPPENRPLLPLQKAQTPPVVPPLFPEDAQHRFSRLPPTYRRRRGLGDSFDASGQGSPTLPTPKPRSRHTPTFENSTAKSQDEEEFGWLCRDDLRGGFRPAVLTRSSGALANPTPHVPRRRSRSPIRRSDAFKRRSMSAENLEGEMGLADEAAAATTETPRSPTEQCKPQRFQSMTSLNETQDTKVYRSHLVVNLDSRPAGKKAIDSRLPIIDGRARSMSTDLLGDGAPSPVRKPSTKEVIRRPTVGTPMIVRRPMYLKERTGMSPVLNTLSPS